MRFPSVINLSTESNGRGLGGGKHADELQVGIRRQFSFLKRDCSAFLDRCGGKAAGLLNPTNYISSSRKSQESLVHNEDFQPQTPFFIYLPVSLQLLAIFLGMHYPVLISDTNFCIILEITAKISFFCAF